MDSIHDSRSKPPTPASLLALVALLCAGCHSAPPHSDADDRGAQSHAAYLYDDLGSHQRPITTRSAAAQHYFDQGLVLAFAFNHDEAIRSFQEAARIDPACAMAWWGIALANGPHINNASLDAEHARAAWAALTKARELASGADALERALIDALGQRYSADAQAERRPLDEAYAAAMRALWRAHPRDGDVGTLCAEALMDLQPWDLWTSAGEPKHATEEIVATLEAVLSIAPAHPGANHLYVHALEASPRPERALAAADRLRTLVPGAGHLVHMPAHIDLRLGHYAQASAANLRAISADKRHRELFPSTGFYRVYMAHNEHFLSFASMMQGEYAVALASARALVDGVPAAFIEQMGPAIDGYMPIVFHALVRFGRWGEILREPAFPEQLEAANAVRHYARGVAAVALDRLGDAESERVQLAQVCTSIDAARTIGNNSARVVLAIAHDMLAGELEFRRGHHEQALTLLRKAAQAEDALVYDEPPDWMMPVRHALGAALLELRRFDEAEQVFQDDLRRFPENGWSLFGLLRCAEGRNQADEARELRARYERAWSKADVELRSPCFCQPGS